ncbi:DUF3618 domain-containing protein [Actinoplanes palleronii]|uniref:DUF3618 domain-containing protein n=1 Tax=Actinoplanes palleronii TaxID=113570 RepID=A0ABQ4BB47_9ACTN|nr:DUF3618 domain-containing protein [Actinoplanes palleronii]GIE67878.1 hypothetical protein Apa02nite_039860 [Actinoplanes palleronii]
MSEKNGAAPAKPDLVALREEIKQTRAELGQTVQALAARADVKARAKDQVELTKQRVRDQAALATGRLRAVAGQATATVKDAAGQATASVKDAAGQTAAVSGELAHDAGVRARTSPIPPALIVAGLAAVVGIILIVRGRR